MDTPSNDALAIFLRRSQWGMCVLAIAWLVWLLAPVLSPFVIAGLLGWLGDPVVDRLERSGRSRLKRWTRGGRR